MQSWVTNETIQSSKVNTNPRSKVNFFLLVHNNNYNIASECFLRAYSFECNYNNTICVHLYNKKLTYYEASFLYIKID